MLILLDVDGTPVQFLIRGSPSFFGTPILFNPLTKMVTKQRKHQPTLIMTARVLNFLMRDDVTHDGAFGSDHSKISKAHMKERFIDGCFNPSSESWVAVWKFPGDLNHIKDQSNNLVFEKIVDVPLPVGAYPLLDDEWTEERESIEIFPKGCLGAIEVLDGVEGGVGEASLSLSTSSNWFSSQEEPGDEL
jgi:hypothetical protein